MHLDIAQHAAVLQLSVQVALELRAAKARRVRRLLHVEAQVIVHLVLPATELALGDWLDLARGPGRKPKNLATGLCFALPQPLSLQEESKGTKRTAGTVPSSLQGAVLNQMALGWTLLR